jgi:hypothetical protein
MRNMKSLIAWWRRPSPSPAPPFISVVPKTVNTRPVVREYQPLYAYLDHRHASTVVLTFLEMEALLGRPLPTVAHREQAWWTGASTDGSRQAEAWTMAGRTAQPNFVDGTVVFERRG